MGLFNKKHIISGLAASLLMTSGLFAENALFDDHSDKTNQNEFEYYWYYYDDNSGKKEDDRPFAGEGTTPSVVNVTYTKKDGVEGLPADHEVKEYTFTVGEEDDNAYATTPFTFGEQWMASWCSAAPCAWPFIGIGSMLNADGKTIDLSTATGVKFKIRAKNSDLTVRFKVETQDIIESNTFGYYQSLVTATAGEWTSYTVNFEDMEQPSWAQKDSPFDFDLKIAAKLAWEVSQEDNAEVTEDCLDVDDIEVLDYKFISRFMWIQEDDPIEVGRLISNFDAKTAPNELKLPYDGKENGIIQYWYAYDDGDIGGTSEVTGGATKNEKTNKLDISFEEGTGVDDSKAAFLEFEIGEAIPQDTIEIMGFVGVGCNLYDSTKSKYYDAKADKATGVTFSYMADGDMKKVTVELSDVNDVADGEDPETTEERGSGVVMFRDLPVTAGEWATVTIPFSEFLFHDDWESAKDIPLDITKLAKFQVKVQGGEGVAGFMAVDDVRFANADAVKFTYHNAVKTPFKAAYVNGKINISFNNSDIASGKISIVNTRGAVVKSIPVSSTRSLSTSISTDRISAGMYLVKLDAKSLNGKSVVRQAKLNIVK